MAQLTRVWDQMIILNWHEIRLIDIIGTINKSFLFLEDARFTVYDDEERR